MNKKKFVILGLIIIVLVLISSNTIFNGQMHLTGNYYGKENKSLDKFSKIELELNYSNIKIIPSKSKKYEIKIKYNNKSELEYSVKDDNLTISDSKLKLLIPNVDFFSEVDMNEIEIHIPKGINIDNLDGKISTAMDIDNFGIISIENMNINSIDLLSKSNIVIINSNIQNGNIGLKYNSKLNAEKSKFTNIDLNSENGDILLNGNLEGKNKISSKDGKIILNLTQEEKDIDLIFDDKTESIKLNGENITIDDILDNYANNSIEFNDSDEIQIDFKGNGN